MERNLHSIYAPLSESRPLMPTPFAARLLPCLLGLVLLGLPSSRAQGTVPAGT